MNNLIEMFNYGFMIKALIVGLMIALSAGLIGVPIVLRRNAMIGDGLSHVGFAAFVVATVFGFAPLEFAIPVVIIASFLITKLSLNSKIDGDSAIALVATSSLAIGVFLISIFGVNIDINSYLFGSILAVNNSDMVISIVLSIIIILFYILFYHRIFAITFDSKFSKSIGINTQLYEMIFAALSSVVIVLGMRLAGALLISSLIIFPVLTARCLSKSFKGVSIWSVIISIVGYLIGLLTSFVFSIPTGATITIIELILFVIIKILYNVKI